MMPLAQVPQQRYDMESSAELPAAASSGEFLAFRLGEEEYGVDILHVQEIRGYVEPTHIANAAAFIKGVVNLRGTIVPIIDLRLKFSLPQARYDALTVTIVLNIGKRVIGVVVDSVSDVLQLDGQQIKRPPDFTAAVSLHHITGIGTLKGHDGERMLILLDIQRLMSSHDMGLMSGLNQELSH